MKNRIHTLRVTVIGLALLAGLMSPVAVHAGGGTLPPQSGTLTAEPTKIPPTESPTLEPTDAVPPPKDPTATNTPKPPGDATEPGAETTGPAASTPEPIKTTSPLAPTLTDMLQGLPKDTDVVVLDESGKVLPLVSQDAVHLLTQSDPMWCPEGVAPGGAGCTSAYATLTDLLSNAGAYINSQTIHGIIWITSGPIADPNSIAIDGSIYTNWANYNLTLQGGWSGIIGDTTVNPGAISVFSVPITITNWYNGVVVQSIDAPSINLSNVTSTHGNGVAVTSVNSHVNLDNIRVDHAVGAGLQVVTTGAILANNISSTNNQDRMPSDFLWPQDYGIGALLQSESSLITLTGTNVFSNNAQVGLIVSSSGDLAMSNVTASNNYWEGIILSSWNGNATLSDIDVHNNGYTGLFASAAGDLAADNLTANNNYSAGAILSSVYGSVKLTGVNTFNGNVGSGLSVGAPGDVTLNQVTVLNNGWGGLEIVGARDITLNNVIAESNGNGVFIIYVNNVFFSGGSITNNDVGLFMYCVNSYELDPASTTITNNITNIMSAYDDWFCPFTPPPPTPQPRTFLQPQGELFGLDCATVEHRYIVRLANGDRGEIYCPVTGKASIDRVDNTTLPGTLPVGYTYVSAFDVKILKNDEAIPVITEGGHIIASFVAPNSEFGNSYSILYWDGKTGTWIPLKDFLLDQKGTSEGFELYPGVPEDERRILSGVNFVTKNGESRVEVSTNFPGIFVLAQH